MFLDVIPARYRASRLPGKPLLPISSRLLIHWVLKFAHQREAAFVIVATDDERIRREALTFEANWVMTATHRLSDTNGIAEVVRARGFASDDIVVNLQDDAPRMPPRVRADVAAALHRQCSVDVATAVASSLIQAAASLPSPRGR